MATPKKSGRGVDGTSKRSVEEGIVPNNPEKAASGESAAEIHTQELDISSGTMTADDLVKKAKKIIVDHMESALGALGMLFLFGVFSGMWRRVLHGKPTKEPVMKKVLAHKDAKPHRRRYVEALISAAVDQEWSEKGLEFQDLGYSHRHVLGQIKDEDLRLSFAQRAQNEGLSVKDLKEAIRDHTLSLESPGSVQSKHIVRQIKTIVGFMKDKDTRALLMDRQQLETIDEDSRMEILRYSKQAKKVAINISELFGKVSDTIIDIESVTPDSKDNDIQEDSEEDSGEESEED